MIELESSPTPTKHAREQLLHRASRYVTSVEASWKRGSRVHIPNAAPVPHHDEARYDSGTDTVLFAREENLTTAYGVEPEHITNIHGVAVAVCVDEQYGTSYTSRIDPGQLEETNR